MQLPWKNAGRARAGLTLIEVTVACSVVATVLLAAASGFTGSLKSVGQSKSISRASVYLESVMEDLSALDYDALLAKNGAQYFDHTNALDSKFSVSLVVFPAQLDLLQLRATLTDLQTGDTLGTLTTQRSRR